jgi:hypothetical protein
MLGILMRDEMTGFEGKLKEKYCFGFRGVGHY